MSDPQLTVLFELTGRKETKIKSWQIDTSYLTSCDGFSFEVYNEDRSKLRGLELQPVELLVDGKSQLLGRVDITTVGGDGSAVTCEGRDYISDIVECCIDPLVQFKEGMTVSDAFALALRPLGITGVISDSDIALRNIRTGKSITGNTPPKSFKAAKLDDYKPQDGAGCYEVLNKIAARHGATIQPSNSRGSVTLSAPYYAQSPTYKLVRTVSGTKNNVLSATATRDYSKFPTYTLFHGKQGRPGESPTTISSVEIAQRAVLNAFAPLTFGASLKAVPVGPKAPKDKQGFDMEAMAAAFSSEIATILDGKIASGRQRPDKATTRQPQLYRLLYLNDKDARNLDQIYFGARRAIAERLKDTLEYRCTVKGVVDPVSGAVWSVDTMVNVQDEICGVDEPLWIAERTLKFDPGSGATTDLVCWRPESFQVE